MLSAENYARNHEWGMIEAGPGLTGLRVFSEDKFYKQLAQAIREFNQRNQAGSLANQTVT